MHFQLIPARLRTALRELFDPAKLPEEQAEPYRQAAAAALAEGTKRARLALAVPRLKALTIDRPYPWLIATGRKPIENRTWPPPPPMIGQRLCIHAGQAINQEQAVVIRQHFGIEFPADAWDTGIVAIATIDRVFDAKSSDVLSESPWYSGGNCLAWVLRDVVRFPAVPCRGMQRLWDVPADVARIAWYRMQVTLAMNEQ
jgi:hypothetical protein